MMINDEISPLTVVNTNLQKTKKRKNKKKKSKLENPTSSTSTSILSEKDEIKNDDDFIPYQIIPNFEYIPSVKYTFSNETRAIVKKADVETLDENISSQIITTSLNKSDNKSVINPESLVSKKNARKKFKSKTQHEKYQEATKRICDAEMQKQMDEIKEEMKRGLITTVWIKGEMYEKTQSFIGHIWYAPEDKRNKIYCPPNPKTSKKKVYLQTIFKAILQCTDKKMFQKGDALIINVDDGDVLTYLMENKNAKNIVYLLAKKLWEQNGTDILFLWNGIQVPTKGLALEKAIIHSASRIAQQRAIKQQNEKQKNRCRARSFRELDFESEELHKLTPMELGQQFVNENKKL